MTVIAQNVIKRGSLFEQEIRRSISKKNHYDGCGELKAQIRGTKGIPEFVEEFKFHPTRKWRFDIAWPEKQIAVEYEGATWIAGRHTRGSGFAKDCEKYNSAVCLGWKVLRFTAEMVKSGEALATILKLRKLTEKESE